MTYSSSLTDKEWRILEPLLPQVLPKKEKENPSLRMGKARNSGWNTLSTQEWL